VKVFPGGRKKAIFSFICRGFSNSIRETGTASGAAGNER
jgi:hypothetical protein